METPVAQPSLPQPFLPLVPLTSTPPTGTPSKPLETRNIVYATVPHIPNPSAEASPNPGTPDGIRPPVPNTGPAGTLDLHLDVYQVASDKPTPVVLQIHGGGWIRGDRPSSSGSFGAFFAAGMSVVAVQYRNAIDAPAPAAIQDVRCAMAWVKAQRRQVQLRPQQVVTWGGSAGGHLALMAGYAPASLDPPGCTDQPKVVAVIDMFGASDVAESLTFHGSMDFTHQWIGLDLPLPPDARVSAPHPRRPLPPPPSPSTPTACRVRAVKLRAGLIQPRPCSPAPARCLRFTYIHPGLPPTFIINGDQDHTYNPTQSYKLKAALDAAHVPNEEDIVVGGGHGNFSPAENQKGTLLWMPSFATTASSSNQTQGAP